MMKTYDEGRSKYAITSFILGIANLLIWFIPFCGLPIVIAGLGFGYAGRDSPLEKWALAGIVMAYIGLAITIFKVLLTLYATPLGTG